MPTTARQLFEAFQACAVKKDGAAFGDLFAENATLEFPFVPGAGPLCFRGRAEIRARAIHAWTASPRAVERFEAVSILDGADAGSLVAEYEIHGTDRRTSLPFLVRAILLLDTEDGKIVSMREYLDPVALSGGRTPFEVLRLFHAAMRAKSADDLADLYAEDGVHAFAFPVPNRPPMLVGREAVRAAYRDGWRNHPLTILSMDDVFVHRAEDPEVVFGQWKMAARVAAEGREVQITGALMLRVRAGVIVRCDDFMDGLGVARALGRQPFAEAG